MKQQLLHFSSILLIAAMAVVNAPLSLLHHHEEIEHCDHSEDLNDLNPCHISVSHLGEDDAACDHQSHVSKEENECEWCTLLTPKRNKYSLPEFCAFGAILNQNSEIQVLNDLPLTRAVIVKSTRAPPVA